MRDCTFKYGSQVALRFYLSKDLKSGSMSLDYLEKEFSGWRKQQI